MRNAFAAVLVIFAVPALALPPVVGRFAEDAFMAQAEGHPFADYLEVEVVEYDRGLYRSRATLRFGVDSTYLQGLRAAARADAGAEGAETLEELEALRGDVTFRVVADLAHGPVGFSRGPFVGLAKGVMRPELEGGVGERWRQRLDVPWLFEVRHRLRFGGSSRFDLVIPEIDYQGEGGGLTLEGWDVWAEFDPERRHLSGEAALAVLEVSGEGSNLRVESVRAEGEATILSPSIAEGGGAFRVERLSLLQATGEVGTTDMVGLRMTWSTELTDGGAALDSRFGYAVDSLLLDDRALRDAEVTLAVRNVDRDAAERWSELTRTFWPDAQAADPATVADEVGGIVHDFLAAGPVFEVEPARFSYDGGSLEARLRIAADPSVLPAREEFEPLAPDALALWSRMLTGEAEVEVARSLARTLVAEGQESTVRAQMARVGRSPSGEEVRAAAREQADLLLETLVEAGYLRAEDDRYRSSLSYEDGRLTANGRPLALPGG